jgi:anti-sigma-K factor RskA
MTMDPHDGIQPLLTDYALGELPSAERRRVAAHLAACAECAAEAREVSLALQSIGLSLEPVAPPVHLRSRVLESLARDRPPQRTESRRTAPAGWPSQALLGLAAALVLVLGGLLALSLQRTQRLSDELRRAGQETARLAEEISETSAQADLAVSILTATDMRQADLAGLETSRNATARGYWSPSQGLLIVADRLPAPPPGRIYQVWLIGSAGGGPVSAGLMDGQRTGRGMLIVPAPGGVTGSSVTIAVTDEPIGGLPAPTGAKHLVGSL